MAAKRPTDVNKLAASIVGDATSEKEPQKNDAKPTAAEIGRKGGKKGGPARASALDPERRKEIAKKAAEKRWRPE